MSESIGDRIAHARGLKGWDQAELAEKIPCNRVQVSQWEKGQNPSAQSRAKLARALNVRSEWLLYGSGSMEAGPLDNLTIEDFQGPRDPSVPYMATGTGKTHSGLSVIAALQKDQAILHAVLEALLDSNVPREQLAQVFIEAYQVTQRTKRIDQVAQLVKMLIS